MGPRITLHEQTESGSGAGHRRLHVSRAGARETVDHRADIFAFGAILYEMLTGKRAFKKPTSAETMTAILNEDPPAISQVAPTTPPALAANRAPLPGEESRAALSLGIGLGVCAGSPVGIGQGCGARLSLGRRYGSPREQVGQRRERQASASRFRDWVPGARTEIHQTVVEAQSRDCRRSLLSYRWVALPLDNAPDREAVETARIAAAYGGAPHGVAGERCIPDLLARRQPGCVRMGRRKQWRRDTTSTSKSSAPINLCA